MADEKLTAATRLEKLLDNIAGGENEVTPATRLEKFLSYIADAIEGESGGSGVTLYGPYIATHSASRMVDAGTAGAVNINKIYDPANPSTELEFDYNSKQMIVQVKGYPGFTLAEFSAYYGFNITLYNNLAVTATIPAEGTQIVFYNTTELHASN